MASQDEPGLLSQPPGSGHPQLPSSELAPLRLQSLQPHKTAPSAPALSSEPPPAPRGCWQPGRLDTCRGREQTEISGPSPQFHCDSRTTLKIVLAIALNLKNDFQMVKKRSSTCGRPGDDNFLAVGPSGFLQPHQINDFLLHLQIRL